MQCAKVQVGSRMLSAKLLAFTGWALQGLLNWLQMPKPRWFECNLHISDVMLTISEI